jgi:hypothetical protein
MSPLLWTVIPLKDQDSHLPFLFGLQICSLCRARYVTFKPNRRIFKRSTPRSLQHDLKNRYQVCLAAYLSHSLGFSAVHEVSSCCNHLFKAMTSKQLTRNACPHLQQPNSSHYTLDLREHPPCQTVSGLSFQQKQFAAQKKRLPAVAYQQVKLSLGIGLENIELANGHERRTPNKVRAAVPPGQGGPALTESTRNTA